MKNFTFFYLIYILYLISPSYSSFDLEIPSASLTHIVPHRKEDPYFDLRLHPAKGATIVMKEKTFTCTHPYFGRVFKFDYSEIIEITSSYPAAPFDIFSVTQGMHPYTFKLGGEGRKFRMIAGVREHLYSKSFLTISGELHQRNLQLKFTPKHFNRYWIEFNILLNEIERAALKMNLKRIYIQIPFVFTTNYEPPFVTILRDENYRFLGGFKDLHTRERTDLYFKKVKKCSPQFSSSDSRFYFMIHWEEVSLQTDPVFGVFLRDGYGSILGGITGTFYPEAFVPFGKLTSVWLDPERPNPTYRKKLLISAEVILGCMGLRVSEILINSSQPDPLYGDEGYSSIFTYPQYYKTSRGENIPLSIMRRALSFDYTFSSNH